MEQAWQRASLAEWATSASTQAQKTKVSNIEEGMDYPAGIFQVRKDGIGKAKLSWNWN